MANGSSRSQSFLKKLAKALGCVVLVAAIGLVGIIVLIRSAWKSTEQSLPPVKSPDGRYVANVNAHLLHELSGELTITAPGQSEPVSHSSFNGIAEEGRQLGSVSWSPDSKRVAIVILDESKRSSRPPSCVNAVYVYDLATDNDGIGSPTMSWSTSKKSAIPDKIFCEWQTPDKLQLLAQRKGKNVVPPVQLIVTKERSGLAVDTEKRP